MSAQIQETLADLVTAADGWEDGAVTIGRGTYIATIAALEAAKQEAEAWADVRKWCDAKAKRGFNGHRRATMCEFCLVWPEPFGRWGRQMFHGDDHVEALTKAAAWCRAELTP